MSAAVFDAARVSGARRWAAVGWTRWRVAVLLIAVVGALGVAGTAAAWWAAGSVVGGNGAGVATSVNQGATPTASAGIGPRVNVSWSAGTLTSGTPVSGYLVKRYDADTNALQTTLTGCSGTVAAVSCTENTVPAGEWKYSITPVIGTNWQGAESPLSGVVVVSPAIMTLAKTIFGPPLPNATTGTLSGFTANEGITYRLDAATSITGSPASVTAGGTATITNIVVPVGTTEGAHTLYAVGANGTLASVAIVVDTVAPTASAQLSPAANGAGWNNAAAVQVLLTGADGVNGSGISQIRYTTDGTDPTVSGSTQTYTDLLLTSTKTVKYYAIDAAGNTSGVYTQQVRIDTVAPANTITVSNANGNAYKSGNTVYYRGEAVSGRSFTLTNAVSDAGSGPTSSGTTALSGTTTGWSHSSGTVSTPAAGPYVSAAFTWALNTTSAPVENVIGTDVAGNTTTTQLTYVNDSTAPTGGSISYDEGSTSVFSIPVGFTTGTDATVGLAPTGRLLQRRQVALTNGSCATFVGVAYATIATDPASPYTDTGVTNGFCYQYQYVVPDNINNQASYTSVNTVRVSTYASAVGSTTGLRSHWRLGELDTKDTYTGGGPTLGTHTSDNGVAWTNKSASWPVITAGGALRKPGATGYEVYSNAVPPSANYSVEADFTVATTSAGNLISLAGRIDTGSENYYYLSYNANDPGWNLWKVVNGVAQAVPGGTVYYNMSLAAGSTTRVRLEMNGSAISGWINGVRRVWGTDASVTGVGRAGIHAWGAANHSDTSGIFIDNFVAAPLAAADSKGTNHGTYTNAPKPGEDGPLTNDTNAAAAFDQVGSIDHVVVPHNATLNVGDSFSVEAWVKRADNVTTMQTIVHKGIASTGFQWGFLNNRIGLFKNGVAIAQSTTTQTDMTVFHHYVVTKNGATVKLYVDGIDVTDLVTNQTIADTANPLYIGAEAGTAEGLNGTIDEVSLYSGALSAATVIDHQRYFTTSQYAKAVAAESSLLRQYRFGELNHTIDTFGGTVTSTLDSRVGEFGATWIRHSSSSVGATAVLMTGNEVRKNATATKGAVYYTSTMPPTADYKIDVDAQPYQPADPADFDDSVAVIGRFDAATNSYYMARRDYEAASGSTILRLFKVINGVETQLGTDYSLGAGTGALRLGLDMNGTTIRAQSNGGSPAATTVTDSSITANGYGGLMIGNVRGASSTTYSDTAGFQADNFRINPPTEDSKGGTHGDYYLNTTLGAAGALVGDANTAVKFNSATSDFVRTPPQAFDDFTAEFWFKSAAVASSSALIDADATAAGSPDWGMYLTSTGLLVASIGGTPDVTITSASEYDDGVWHHTAFTRNATTGAMTLYVDGRSVGSATGATVTRGAVYDIRIARTSQGGNNPYNGHLDEVALYTAVLPFATVTRHYDLGMGRDGTGPQAGSVDATGLVGTGSRYKANTSLSIAMSKGTDSNGLAGSGFQLRRSEATLSSTGVSDGTCGGYGASTLLATDPATPYADAGVVTGKCYQYEYLSKDALGNTTTFYSDAVKIDTSAASAPTLTYSNFSNVYAANGTSTVYYRPGATSGTFTVTGASTDAQSGVGGFTMPSLGAGWTTPSGTTGTQTYAFASASPTTSSGNVTAFNGSAMTSATTALTMTVDSTPPTVTGMSLTYTNGAHTSGALNVTMTGAPSDGGSGLGNRLLQRAIAPLASGTCGTYGTFTTIATNPASPYADSVSNAYCYKYQYLVYDKVGNMGTPVVHTSGAATAAKVNTVATFFQTGTNNLVVMEAENYTVNNTQGADDWTPDTSNVGYSGAGSMATADTAGHYTSPGYAAESSRLDFEVNFATTGTHYVWVRTWHPNSNGDSFHVGLDYLENATADNGAVEAGTPASWQWVNINFDNATPLTITVPTTGLHTVNVYPREAGIVVDKVLLTTNAAYVPTGTGPAETVGEILGNGDFDDASTAPWTFSGGSITSGTPYRSATKKLVLGGSNSATHTASQQVTIPASCVTPTLRFYRYVTTNESPGDVYDYLKVDIRNAANSSTLVTYNAADNGDSSSWVLNSSYNLTSYKGQTVTIRFRGTTDSSASSTFYVDDASLTCS
jgi:hypothetical protein